MRTCSPGSVAGQRTHRSPGPRQQGAAHHTAVPGTAQHHHHEKDEHDHADPDPRGHGPQRRPPGPRAGRPHDQGPRARSPNVRPGQQMRISVPPAAAPKATKPAAVPANQSRGRLPVAGLVGKSFGLYQKDQKAWLALDETKRLVKIDVGHRFSRKSAKKLCEERGGRLAYRREVVDEATLRHRLSLGAAVELVGLSNAEFNGRRGVVAAPPADLAAGRVAVTVDGRTLSLKRENVVAARSASVPRLLVNDGKAFGGDKWIPVLDGDPNKDDEGVGWVQIGDPGRLGKNHREAHGADCTWGGLSQAPHWKGPWIYCVIDEAVTIKTGKWAGWDTARFVAFDVDAGDNRVALRNPGTKRWLRVTPDGETTPRPEATGTMARRSGSGSSCTSSRAASACGARAGAG